jgi:hypothetical protein
MKINMKKKKASRVALFMRSCHRVYVCTISIKNALFINGDVYMQVNKSSSHGYNIYIHPASQKRTFPGGYILLDRSRLLTYTQH